MSSRNYTSAPTFKQSPNAPNTKGNSRHSYVKVECMQRFYNMCEHASKCMRWINWWICKSIPSLCDLCTLKIRWRKVENVLVWLRTLSFGPALFHSLMSLVRQCEADLTDAPCFWLVNPNDWPMWFAISSLSPFASHNFSFMDGIRIKKI
jgi:hypothetical protein